MYCQKEITTSRHISCCKRTFQVTDEEVLVHLAHSTPKQGVMLTQTVVPKSLQPLVLKLAHEDAPRQLAMQAYKPRTLV